MVTMLIPHQSEPENDTLLQQCKKVVPVCADKTRPIGCQLYTGFLGNLLNGVGQLSYPWAKPIKQY